MATENAAALVEAVRIILDDYSDQLPLTLRDVFYIAVTCSLIGKTEVGYNRLTEIMVRARRAKMIPMASFRYDGFTQEQATGWQSADTFAYNVNRWVEKFTLDRQQGQASRLIVWCEAQGMVPQLQRGADSYSVPMYSSGGFDSLTVKHAIARQISESGDTVARVPPWSAMQIFSMGE